MMFRSLRLVLPITALLIVTIAAHAQNPPASPQAAASADSTKPSTASENTTATASHAGADDDSDYGVIDNNDPILKPPPLPKGKLTLVGGTVAKIDRIRNLMVVRPFGGGRMKVYFDERSHIYRDGEEATQMSIRPGDRVYLDTITGGPQVFAKNIRIETTAHAAEARGQVVAYDARTGEMDLRDELSSQPISIRVSQQTNIRREQQAGSAADLLPGSLVAVIFAPDEAHRAVAREITVFATPGAKFLFTGKVTYLDLSRGVLAMQSETDKKNYEIHFDRQKTQTGQLGVGAGVTVDAVFDGSHYMAQSIIVDSAAKLQ